MNNKNTEISNMTKSEIEELIKRKYDISEKRINTPCKFTDGISFSEFENIAQKAKKRFKRISHITIDKTTIYCTVTSQSFLSEWYFQVDFNDWGHITGTYWHKTDKTDSKIHEYYGNLISEKIHLLLKERNIQVLEYSTLINNDNEIGNSTCLSYQKKSNFLQKILSSKKYISINFNSNQLVGEHIYPVICILKNNGFTNIKSIPIKNVSCNSKNYLFEVEQIRINGASSFDIGDTFLDNVNIIISYHDKMEIKMPYSMNQLKNKNYVDVISDMKNMGFSNISERKIKDLITGWLTKDGSIEQVLVKSENIENLIEMNKTYDYDTEFIVVYHTFKNKKS